MNEKFMKECKKVFNHIGLLYDTDIVRLIGYAEDDDDCYYLVLQPDFLGKHKVVWASMVGAFESLKNCHYPRYKQLENQMSGIWNCPPEKDFLIKYKPSKDDWI